MIITWCIIGLTSFLYFHNKITDKKFNILMISDTIGLLLFSLGGLFTTIFMFIGYIEKIGNNLKEVDLGNNTFIIEINIFQKIFSIKNILKELICNNNYVVYSGRVSNITEDIANSVLKPHPYSSLPEYRVYFEYDSKYLELNNNKITCDNPEYELNSRCDYLYDWRISLYTACSSAYCIIYNKSINE